MRQAHRPVLPRRSLCQRRQHRLRLVRPARSSISAILAHEDFDAVTLDMQHGPITLSEVIRAVPLINAAGKLALARIPVR